ncbi:MAG: hypothetical protein AAF253_15310, partial [Pseudomonadota bacterium]
RRLTALADEVRALDTDARLRPTIDATVATLNDLVFDRPFRRHLSRSAALLVPFLLLAAFAATRPLVASFAADRVSGAAAEALAAGLTIALHGFGALLGAALGLALRGRLPQPLILLVVLLGPRAGRNPFRRCSNWGNERAWPRTPHS